MDVVIGIDPGARSGWAALTVQTTPRLLSHDAVTWPKPGDKKDTADNTPTSVVEQILKDLAAVGHTVCAAAIEDQYLSRNPDSMKKLARNAGRWEEAFRARGIRVEWINTQKWQTTELGSCRINSAEVKRRVRRKVRGCWNQKVKAHADDAALIGRYLAIRIAFVRLRKGTCTITKTTAPTAPGASGSARPPGSASGKLASSTSVPTARAVKCGSTPQG